MTSKKNILIAVYCVGVLIAMGLSGFTLTPPEKKLVFSAEPVPFKKASIDGPFHPTDYFRTNVKRSGIGPNQYASLDLEKQWSKKLLNVGIHGASKSSPAVDDSGVYIGSDSSWFYALNHDGTVRWKHYIDGAKNGIHSTAALDEKRVYFGDYKGNLYSFDKQTGEMYWAIRIGETIGASPLIYKDTIIIAVETNRPRNGYVVRIDMKTGRQIWKSEYMGEQSHSSPALDLKNNMLFLGANNDMFFAMDINTGKTIWQKKMDGKIKGTPIIIEDALYFVTWGAHLHALKTKTGEELWKQGVDDRSQGSVTWDPENDLLMIGSATGSVFVINRKNGHVVWGKGSRFINLRQTSASLIYNDETLSKSYLWIACNWNALCVFDGRQMKFIKKFELPGSLTGIPVAFKGKVYLALNAPTGELLVLGPKSVN